MEEGFFLHICNNDETVNSIKYQEAFAQFISYANGLYFDGWVMEQDGATPHTSRQNREFLSGNQVQVLQSPANFPHLWSIENVWQIFKHNVEKKTRNLDEL